MSTYTLEQIVAGVQLAQVWYGSVPFDQLDAEHILEGIRIAAQQREKADGHTIDWSGCCC